MKKRLFLMVVVATLGMNSSVFAYKRFVKNDTFQDIKVTLRASTVGGHKVKATLKPKEMKKLKLRGSCVASITVDGNKVMAKEFFMPKKFVSPTGEVQMRLLESGEKACGDVLLTVRAKDVILKSKVLPRKTYVF